MHAFQNIYKKCDPDERTVDAYKLELSQGFSYRTLLGEMMYAYVTCRPDIGYSITTMSKSPPSHPNITMNFSKESQNTYKRPRIGESNLPDLL